MKNKFTMLLLPLVAGLIIGAAAAWMLCNCCCKTSSCKHECGNKIDTTGTRQISVKVANTYFKSYLANFISIDTLKGFTINSEQFNAMKLISKSDSTVHGFRIYLGMDSLTPVRMVVGIGSPDKVSNIIVTTNLNSGPCPYICDKLSPIIAR
jgi:hypothetical protein